MDNEEIRLDLPCVKYILKKIASEDDVLSFCVFFYKLLSKKGLSDEQIAVEYVTRVSLCDAPFDMFTLSGNKYSVEDLMAKAKESLSLTSSSCCAYCKSKLGSGKCGADICKTCYITPSASNMDFVNEEYALLKYASSSPDNRADLVSKIGNLRSIFRTAVDIVGDIDYPHPIVVLLTNVIYGRMSKSPSFFSEKTLEERLNSPVLNNHVFASICHDNAEVTKILTQFPQLPAAVMGTAIEQIIQADDIADEEMVGRLVDAIYKKRQPKPKTSVNKNPVLSEMAEQSFFDTVEYNRIVETGRGDDAEPRTSKKEQEPVLENSAEIVGDESREPDDVGRVRTDLQPDRSVQEYEVTQDIHEDPLYIPRVFARYISGVKDYTSIEKVVFQSAVNNSHLIYEVIGSPDGSYFLIFCEELKGFVKARVDNLPKSLCILFASKSVKKITWQPYYSYAVLKSYGYVIKNIDSILCSFFADYKNVKYGGYDDVVKRYIRRTQPVTTSGDITGSMLCDRYVACMPCYKEIGNAIIARGMDRKYTKLEKYRDEYLGVSYLRDCLNKTGELFRIDHNGRYIYSEQYTPDALCEGNILSYAINCSHMEPSEKLRVLEYILINMSLRHYFRKFNVQLLALKTDYMALFCDDYSYDAIKTFVRMMMDRYAVEKRIDGFDYTSEQKHVAPEISAISIRPQYIPKNLRMAQNLLTTAADELSISADRVRVKRPVKKVRQKETYPKKKE
jgi:hypothetical protein